MIGLVAVFWALVAVAWRRGFLRARTWEDWVLDLSNLFLQGTLIPWVATWLAVGLWAHLLPGGVLSLGLVGGFLLNFVAVDWLYYWNHRALHAAWDIHKVHHTAGEMDVFVTSRNTLWASFAICYVWANSLFLHLLDDPRGYAFGIVLTAALDLWRHSPAHLHVPGLITPRHHAWHHSTAARDTNFGANLSVWDRLHGTYQPADVAPDALGVPVPLSLGRKLLWPFA